MTTPLWFKAATLAKIVLEDFVAVSERCMQAARVAMRPAMVRASCSPDRCGVLRIRRYPVKSRPCRSAATSETVLQKALTIGDSGWSLE